MTFPADEAARIREYLRTNAAAASVEELIARVEEGVTELATAAAAIDESTFRTVPPNDEWTPINCLSHVVGWNLTCAQQVLWVALSGELPPEQDTSLPAGRSDILAVQREAIDSLYVHVREADPEAFLGTTWQHPFFGELNWREWLLFIRIHSRDHARQLASMRGE